MLIKLALLLILISLCLISDIRTKKIKNLIVFTFILIGLTTNFVLSGTEGLFVSFKGLILPIIFLFFLYILNMIGAGDIKFLGAIGAIMGAEFIFYAAIYSFICGGIISIVIIIFRQNVSLRIKYLYDYIKECFFTLSIKPYDVKTSNYGGGVFRFSYAIFAGTLLQVILQLSLSNTIIK